MPRRLLGALKVERADVMGYSQGGGGVALQLAPPSPGARQQAGFRLSATYRKDGWYPSVLKGIEGLSAKRVCRHARREGVSRSTRRTPRRFDAYLEKMKVLNIDDQKHHRRADAFDLCEDDGHRR